MSEIFSIACGTFWLDYLKLIWLAKRCPSAGLTLTRPGSDEDWWVFPGFASAGAPRWGSDDLPQKKAHNPPIEVQVKNNLYGTGFSLKIFLPLNQLSHYIFFQNAAAQSRVLKCTSWKREWKNAFFPIILKSFSDFWLKK